MSSDKPRFRRDLLAVPVTADEQSYVEVRDPVKGTSFCFYDFEYRVALAFDGLALETVVPWVKLSTGMELEVDQLRAFVSRLDELGFLEPDAAAKPSAGVLAAAVGAADASDSAVETASQPQARAPVVAEAASSIAAEPASETIEPLGTAQTPSVIVAPEQLTAGEAVPSPEPTSTEITPGPPRPDQVSMDDLAAASDAVDEVEVPAEPADTQAESGDTAEAGHEESISALAEVVAEVRASRSGEIVREAGARDRAVTEAERQREVGPAAEAQHPQRAEETPALSVGDINGPPIAPFALNATSFPVLPLEHGADGEHVTPTPKALRPWMTPTPVTFGPSLVTEPRPASTAVRHSLWVFGSLGVLAAVTLLAIVLPFLLTAREPPVPLVRTLVASPATVLRHFDAQATVTAIEGAVLKFPAAGKVARIVGPGSAVAVGDVLAAVEAARPKLAQLAHERERLAFNERIAEAMHEVGNDEEAARQRTKVEARRAAMAGILGSLSGLAVVADAVGTVDEALVREGQLVQQGSPALRLRSPGHQARFELPRAQAASAKRASLCLVEIEGYVFDCTVADTRSDDTHVVVELESAPSTVLGKQARLTRARYEAAFALPTSAARHAETTDEVWIVGASGRAELRPVTIAERSATHAIVVQGLDAGDQVIAEPPSELRAGMRVSVVR